MHLNSELLFRKYAIKYFHSNLKVLEIGPAGFPSAYQKIVNMTSITWNTIDFGDTTFIDNAVDQLTYKIQSPYHFPIDDNVYDIVLSGQVIEHVMNISQWMQELKRIVKVGGHIITINPVSWPYHQAPIDCWRIYPDGIKALAEMNSLKIEECFYESMEKEILLRRDKSSKFIPGKSYNYEKSNRQLTMQIYFNKIIRNVPYLKELEQPIEVAFDTISILKK